MEETIKGLIAKGETEEAIEKALDYSKRDVNTKYSLDAMLLLQSRYSKWKVDFHKGIADNKGLAKINSDFLDLLAGKTVEQDEGKSRTKRTKRTTL